MEQNNSKRFNDDLIIDLRELFWRLLGQWKAIVVIAVIFALLLSGLMYVRTSSAEEIAEETASAEDILSALNPDDQEAVVGLLNEKAALDKLHRYIGESPFMNLDPYNTKCVSLTWLIGSDKDLNKQITAAYINALMSYDIADALNNAWGGKFTADDVRDLVKAESEIPLESDAELTGNILSVKIYIPEGADPTQAERVINETIPTISRNISSSVGEHSIISISSVTQIASDQEISDMQYNVYNRLYNISYQMNYIKNSVLSKSQKEVYEQIINLEDAEEDAEESAATNEAKASFINKKILVAGFILGCIGYAFMYLLYFAFSSKIKSTRVAEESFGIRTLSNWYSVDERVFTDSLFRDKFVFKRHMRGHTDMSREVDRARESIASALKDKDERKILLVLNSQASDKAKDFTEALKNDLCGIGFSADEVEINSKEGLSLGESVLSSYDAVAMVIDKINSRLWDVKEVYDKCYYCGIPLIGASYVE